MDRLSLCRLCGNAFKLSLGVNLFGKEHLDLISKIQSIASVLVVEHDELPNYICNTCHLSLELSYSFQAQCIAAQIKLKKLVKVSPIFRQDEEREIHMQVAPQVKNQSNSTPYTKNSNEPKEKEVHSLPIFDICKLDKDTSKLHDFERAQIQIPNNKCSESLRECDTINDEANESMRKQKNNDALIDVTNEFCNTADITNNTKHISNTHSVLDSSHKANIYDGSACERANSSIESAPQNIGSVYDDDFENNITNMEISVSTAIKIEPNDVGEFDDHHRKSHTSSVKTKEISLKPNSHKESSKHDCELAPINNNLSSDTMLVDYPTNELEFVDSSFRKEIFEHKSNKMQNIGTNFSNHQTGELNFDNTNFSCQMSSCNTGQEDVTMSSCDSLFMECETGNLQSMNNSCNQNIVDIHTEEPQSVQSCTTNSLSMNLHSDPCKEVHNKKREISNMLDSCHDNLSENSQILYNDILVQSQAGGSLKNPFCKRKALNHQTSELQLTKNCSSNKILNPQKSRLPLVKDGSDSMSIDLQTDQLKFVDCSSISVGIAPHVDHSYDKCLTQDFHNKNVVASSAGTLNFGNFQTSEVAVDMLKVQSDTLPPLTICGEPFEVKTLITRADILQYILKCASVNSTRRSRIAHAKKKIHFPDKTGCVPDISQVAKPKQTHKLSTLNDKSNNSLSQGKTKSGSSNHHVAQVTQAQLLSKSKDETVGLSSSSNQENQKCSDVLTKNVFDDVNLADICQVAEAKQTHNLSTLNDKSNNSWRQCKTKSGSSNHHVAQVTQAQLLSKTNDETVGLSSSSNQENEKCSDVLIKVVFDDVKLTDICQVAKEKQTHKLSTLNDKSNNSLSQSKTKSGSSNHHVAQVTQAQLLSKSKDETVGFSSSSNQENQKCSDVLTKNVFDDVNLADICQVAEAKQTHNLSTLNDKSNNSWRQCKTKSGSSNHVAQVTQAQLLSKTKDETVGLSSSSNQENEKCSDVLIKVVFDDVKLTDICQVAKEKQTHKLSTLNDKSNNSLSQSKTKSGSSNHHVAQVTQAQLLLKTKDETVGLSSSSNQENQKCSDVLIKVVFDDVKLTDICQVAKEKQTHKLSTLNDKSNNSLSQGKTKSGSTNHHVAQVTQAQLLSKTKDETVGLSSSSNHENQKCSDVLTKDVFDEVKLTDICQVAKEKQTHKLSTLNDKSNNSLSQGKANSGYSNNHVAQVTQALQLSKTMDETVGFSSSSNQENQKCSDVLTKDVFDEVKLTDICQVAKERQTHKLSTLNDKSNNSLSQGKTKSGSSNHHVAQVTQTQLLSKTKDETVELSSSSNQENEKCSDVLTKDVFDDVKLTDISQVAKPKQTHKLSTLNDKSNNSLCQGKTKSGSSNHHVAQVTQAQLLSKSKDETVGFSSSSNQENQKCSDVLTKNVFDDVNLADICQVAEPKQTHNLSTLNDKSNNSWRQCKTKSGSSNHVAQVTQAQLLSKTKDETVGLSSSSNQENEKCSDVLIKVVFDDVKLTDICQVAKEKQTHKLSTLNDKSNNSLSQSKTKSGSSNHHVAQVTQAQLLLKTKDETVGLSSSSNQENQKCSDVLIKVVFDDVKLTDICQVAKEKQTHKLSTLNDKSNNSLSQGKANSGYSNNHVAQVTQALQLSKTMDETVGFSSSSNQEIQKCSDVLIKDVLDDVNLTDICQVAKAKQTHKLSTLNDKSNNSLSQSKTNSGSSNHHVAQVTQAQLLSKTKDETVGLSSSSNQENQKCSDVLTKDVFDDVKLTDICQVAKPKQTHKLSTLNDKSNNSLSQSKTKSGSSNHHVAQVTQAQLLLKTKDETVELSSSSNQENEKCSDVLTKDVLDDVNLTDICQVAKAKQTHKLSTLNDNSNNSFSQGKTKSGSSNHHVAQVTQALQLSNTNNENVGFSSSSNQENQKCSDYLTKDVFDGDKLHLAQPRSDNKKIKLGRSERHDIFNKSERHSKDNIVPFHETTNDPDIAEVIVMKHKRPSNVSKANNISYMCEPCGKYFQCRLSYIVHVQSHDETNINIKEDIYLSIDTQSHQHSITKDETVRSNSSSHQENQNCSDHLTKDVFDGDKLHLAQPSFDNKKIKLDISERHSKDNIVPFHETANDPDIAEVIVLKHKSPSNVSKANYISYRCELCGKCFQCRLSFNVHVESHDETNINIKEDVYKSIDTQAHQHSITKDETVRSSSSSHQENQNCSDHLTKDVFDGDKLNLAQPSFDNKKIKLDISERHSKDNIVPFHETTNDPDIAEVIVMKHKSPSNVSKANYISYRCELCGKCFQCRLSFNVHVESHDETNINIKEDVYKSIDTQAHQHSITKDETVRSSSSSHQENQNCSDHLTKDVFDGDKLNLAQPSFDNKKIKLDISERHSKDNIVPFHETANDPDIAEVIVMKHKSPSNVSKANYISYRCELCGKCFQCRLSYIMHVEFHDKTNIKENLVRKSVKCYTKSQEYKCKSCDKSFNDQSTLRKHVINSHQKIEFYLCKTCGKSFIDLKTLTFHAKMICKTYSNVKFVERNIISGKEVHSKIHSKKI